VDRASIYANEAMMEGGVHENDGGPGSILRVFAPRVAAWGLSFSTVMQWRQSSSVVTLAGWPGPHPRW
jgi:hypothetical protein